MEYKEEVNCERTLSFWETPRVINISWNSSNLHYFIALYLLNGELFGVICQKYLNCIGLLANKNNPESFLAIRVNIVVPNAINPIRSYKLARNAGKTELVWNKF